MSYETVAEVNTVPPALIRPYVLGDPNGRASLVAPEVTSSDRVFPNFDTEAQPELDAVPAEPAGTADDIYSYEGRHRRPESLKAASESKEASTEPQTGEQQPYKLKSRLARYNPAHVGRYIAVKLRTETWATPGRLRAGVVIGGLAAIGTGVAIAAYNIKHGGLDVLFDSGTHTSPAPDALHTPHETVPAPDPDTGYTPDSTPDSTPHTPPTAEHAEPPQPEPETRTALRYDAATGRASNVHDWSVDALEQAARDAGLTPEQTTQLAHNHRYINQVSAAFYQENPAVATDTHHYLNAGAEYGTETQDATAHDIINTWREEHAPQSDAVIIDEEPELSGLSPDGDKTLEQLLAEIENDPAYAAQAEPPLSPSLQPERFGWFTETQAKAGIAAIGTGVLATAAAIPGTKPLRERRQFNKRHSDDWGHNASGKPLRNHREFERFGKFATAEATTLRAKAAKFGRATL